MHNDVLYPPNSLFHKIEKPGCDSCKKFFFLFMLYINIMYVAFDHISVTLCNIHFCCLIRKTGRYIHMYSLIR